MTNTTRYFSTKIRCFRIYFYLLNLIRKQLIVPNKKIYKKITNDRPVYILPLVNYNVYWPIIGHFYCMTSFFIMNNNQLPHCYLISNYIQIIVYIDLTPHGDLKNLSLGNDLPSYKKRARRFHHSVFLYAFIFHYYIYHFLMQFMRFFKS